MYKYARKGKSGGIWIREMGRGVERGGGEGGRGEKENRRRRATWN